MEIIGWSMAFALILVVIVKFSNPKRRRGAYINNYVFPRKIKNKVLEQHPHLSSAQADLVIEGLREYFQVCNHAGRQFVSMPSEAVDTAWHEFILFTKKYQAFCQKGLGKFLHHTPAEGMNTPMQAQRGIRTAWRISCERANIEPNSPTTLPLLFGLDARLKITNGFTYSLDCQRKGTHNNGSGKEFCASHIATGSSGCGGGYSSSSNTDIDSSGDSGCGGGGGCGGGCGS